MVNNFVLNGSQWSGANNYYKAKVNVNKKVEKVADTQKTKSQPAEKMPVKKEAKAQKNPKAVKASDISIDKKKKSATTNATQVKKETKKKSS